jgi:rhodanese-related sulfurtransferase
MLLRSRPGVNRSRYHEYRRGVAERRTAMPVKINRLELQHLLERGVQLVDALPAEDYADDHIVGAINIPLKDLDHKAPKRLDPQRPVVVYCADLQCDISPRAAVRLETLGFTEVYDYAAGKLDWSAFGLPMEGRLTEQPLVRDVVRPEPHTCSLTETVGTATERLDMKEPCYVVAEDGTVLGRLGTSARKSDASSPASGAMSPGPSTYRPDVPLTELVPKLRAADVTAVPITDPDGRLLGVLYRSDAEHALHEWHGRPEPMRRVG